MKATVEKVYKRIEIKERKQDGITGYDIDNNYPDRVRDIIASSSMGTSCSMLYRKFIFGKGYQDIDFSKKVINNKGLTTDKLLRKLSRDISDFYACYVHVNYNALYEISSINYQPFSHVRLTSPDNKDYPNVYAIHKNWADKRIKKDDIKYINKYNPDPNVIQKEVEAAGGWESYKGQLYFYSFSGESYPLAVCDASLEDMQTDSQSKIYKFRNVSTNFMASHILKLSKIEGDNASQQLQGIKDSVTEFQGADDTSKVMVVEVESEDQVFKLEKVERQEGDREFEWTETSVRNNIRQAYLIPPALLMELDGKIAVSADEMIDAINSFNTTTADERLALEEISQTLYSRFHDKTINPQGNYVVSPLDPPIKEDAQKKKDIQALIGDSKYTAEQKIQMLVNMYNYSDVDARKLAIPNDIGNTERTLSEKLGVGGTQSMMSVLSDPVMTPEQKRGALSVLFGLDKEQIDLLIPNVTNPNSTAKL